MQRPVQDISIVRCNTVRGEVFGCEITDSDFSRDVRTSSASRKVAGLATPGRVTHWRNWRKLVSTRPGNFPGALTCDLRGGNTTWKS